MNRPLQHHGVARLASGSYHRTMARFYFNYRNGAEFLEDPDGLDLADIATARATGIASLRDILAEDVLAGLLHRSSAIEIEDADRQPVYIVALADALTER